MALSIPLGMGSEVSVSDVTRAGRKRGAKVRDGILSATGLRNSGTERSARSCALTGEGAAEAIDLGGDGRPERTYCDPIVYAVSESAQEAVLGESFLGQRLLRGYGRTEQRYDPKIRKVPRKRRAESGATASGTMGQRTFSEGPLV